MTTDGHRVYLEAVEGAFGAAIDYAMLIKLYGTAPEAEKRSSPAECIGVRVETIQGAGARARLYELRGAPELDATSAHAPLHPLDQWLLQDSK